jgi:thioredoxin reductase/ferredoxin-like protein FixX
MKTSQLLIIVTLLLLLLTINQFFTGASTLKRYLGGLPWYGWAGIGVFLVLAAALFALRDAVRARRFLEEPIEPHIETKQQRTRLKQDLLDRYDEVKVDYPHPVVITERCIGCRACVEACPHDVLEMVGNVASATAVEQCMENTRCEIVCPVAPKACVVVNATKEIKLLPVPPRDDKFMAKDVPGCYIIGDVSGTPLIKNAANEGAAVIEFIRKELEPLPPEPNAEFEVAIIGIGPAGLSAAVRAKQRGLKFVGIERDKVLATINMYPKDKYLFFKPETMKAVGAIHCEGDGDQCQKLLDLWTGTMKSHEVEINEQEECESVKPEGNYFTITTKKGEKGAERASRSYTARRVIIAVGNRGEPRKLDAPGVVEGRVRYALSNPDEFKGKKIIVVGGGNASVEAVVALASNLAGSEIRPPNEINEVTFVLRTNLAADVKFPNKQLVYDCIDEGQVKVHFGTSIKKIRERDVIVMDTLTGEEKDPIPNDYVFAMIGGVPPIKFLEDIGIKIPKG